MKQLSRLGIQRMIDGAGSTYNSGFGGGDSIAGMATEAWVNGNFVSIEFFSKLFQAYGPAEEEGDPDVAVNPNDLESTISNIKAQFGLWTEQYLSALGLGDGGGGGTQLNEPLNSINTAGLADHPSGSGQTIVWNGSAWVYGTAGGAVGVTSVAMSMPTGFTVTGTPITSSGTLAVTFASGYSLPTDAKQTNWDTAYGWGNHATAGYAMATDVYSKTDADGRFLTISFFRSLFKAYQSNGTTEVAPNAGDTSLISSIKAMFGFWTDQYLSALGLGSGGGGSITLNEPLNGINNASLGAPSSAGQTLVWNGSAWKYSSAAGISATSLNIGGSASISGVVTAAGGFSVSGKDNTYVVLAGGGTKLLSEIGGGGSVNSIIITGTATPYTPDANGAVTLPAYPSTLDQIADGTTRKLANYLPLTGGTVSGTITATNLRATSYYYMYSPTSDAFHAVIDRSGDMPIVGYGFGLNNYDLTVTGYNLHLVGGNSYGTYANGINILANGNVGVGVTNPAYRLSVGGTAHITGATSLDSTLSVAGQITSSVATGTAPFAVASTTVVTNLNADYVDGYHPKGGYSVYGGLPYVSSSGFMDIGNDLEFHYDNTTNIDYSTRIYCTGNHQNSVALPSGTGTLALTSDLSEYLPLSGGTITGSLTVNVDTTVSKLLIGSNYITTQNSYLAFRLNGNELVISSSVDTSLYINYRTIANNYAPSEFIWCAGTGTSRASHSIGNLNASGTATIGGLITANGGITIPSGQTLTIGDAVLSWDSTNQAIKITKGFYSQTFISALGSSSGGGGGVTLNEPLNGINNASLGAPSSAGQTLVWNGTAWKYSSAAGITATSLNIGGSASISGVVTAAGGFSVSGKDNTYVVLAGGGTKLLSEIGGGSYLPLSGGTVTGALQVNGNIGCGNYFLMNSDAGYISIIDKNTAANEPIFGYGFGRNQYPVSITGYTLYLVGGDSYDAKTKGITISSSGYVGIGTTTPSYKLDVVGSVRVDSQITSSLATGTAPLSVTSTTLCTNLNADYLDGFHHTSFAKTQAVNNLVFGGNEICFVGSAFSGYLYVNYRTTSGPDGSISAYIFSNGATAQTEIWAKKFVTESGTSSQFVKGDGSLDSSTYATQGYVTTQLGGYLPLTGGTLTGNLYASNIGVTSYYYMYSPTQGGYLSLIDKSGDHPIFGYGFGAKGYSVTFTGYNINIVSGNIYNSTTNGLYILANGNVGIGTNNPSYKLSLVGTLHATGAATLDSTLSVAGQITSTLATGTAPFAITSTTKVSNLNVDLLDDLHASDFTQRRYTNFYPFVASYYSGRYYKITLPYTTPAAGSAKWYMTTMDLVLAGSYNRDACATIKLCYYIYWNGSAFSAPDVRAYASGSNITHSGVTIKYNPSTPYVFYVCAGINSYNGIAIENLSSLDSSTAFDFKGTTIESVSSIPSTATSAVSMATTETNNGTDLLFKCSGTVGFDTGNVGIGTTSPSYKLHVAGTFYASGNSSIGGTLTVTGTSTLTGNVAIGTSVSTSYALNVAGAVYASTGFYSAGYVTAASDIRKKNQIGDCELTAKEVALAPSIRFTWKDERIKGVQVGSVAQYWLKVLPEAVREDADGMLTMDYGVIALLSSIATAKKVEDHERRIAELERENEELKRQLKAA